MPPASAPGADLADTLERLSRLQGPGELRAACLALAVQPACEPTLAAWAIETRDVRRAAALLADASAVPEDRRLAVLDALLRRLGRHAKPERRLLLLSARRVMAAHAPRRALDRLHWLLMRRRLGDAAPAALPAGAVNDLADLPEPTLAQLAHVTAYLSRMVPGGDAPQAQAWIDASLRRLLPADRIPACTVPDGDGFVHALAEAQTLPWMLRPVLVRAWVDAALAEGRRARLPARAADALRLVADLLDCPLPPELGRHFAAVDWQ